jgi:hypothetical protein
LDHDKKRLEHLHAIVAAAEDILGILLPDMPAVASFYGLRCPSSSKENKQKHDKTKAWWVDALMRKARAQGDLGHMEDMATTVQTLGQWANVDDHKFIHVMLMEDLRLVQYGSALKVTRRHKDIVTCIVHANDVCVCVYLYVRQSESKKSRASSQENVKNYGH